MAEFYILDMVYDDDMVGFSVPADWAKGCRTSDFQYLDQDPVQLEVIEGSEFPDFMLVDGYIPIVSQHLKILFEEVGINNLFFKKIILDYFGQEETHWLALPPRISCTDPEKAHPVLHAYQDIHEVQIIPERVGNYQIFKLAGVGNQEILITSTLQEYLKERIRKDNLKGIRITKL